MGNTVKKKVPRFMRFWQIYFAFIVTGNLLALLLITSSSTQFYFTDYMDLFSVVYAGVLLWLMWSRKKVTRYVVPVFSVTFLLVGVTGDFIFSGFVWDFSYLVDDGRAIGLIAGLYFLTSKKAKQVLTEDFDTEPSLERGAERHLFRPKELLFWRNILLYFMIFAIVGHWLELGYCTFLRYFTDQYDPNSGIWSNYLYPYNVYGIGAIACVLLLYPIKELLSKKIPNTLIVIIVSFIANATVCTLIELAMGMMVNMPDANGVYPLWDYSGLPFNFMGQICLQNALAFGVAATFMVWIAFPALERLVASISKDAMTAIFIALIVFYLMLSTFYFFDFQLPVLT